MLADIDFDYLQVWGHYRTLVDLHGRIHGRITDPALNAAHLTNLGLCHFSLGDYRQAIDLHTQALAIARDIGDRRGEGAALGNLGICHCRLGEYRQAIDLLTQALAIARDTGNRRGEGADWATWGSATSPGRLPAGHRPAHPGPGHRPRHRRPPERGRRLGNLGICHSSLGDYRQAIDLHTQALAIARDTGNRQDEGIELGNLGICHFCLGDYRQAIDLHTQALAIARDIGDRYGEANALDYLGRAWLASGDARRAVTLLEPGGECRRRHRRHRAGGDGPVGAGAGPASAG